MYSMFGYTNSWILIFFAQNVSFNNKNLYRKEFAVNRLLLFFKNKFKIVLPSHNTNTWGSKIQLRVSWFNFFIPKIEFKTEIRGHINCYFMCFFLQNNLFFSKTLLLQTLFFNCKYRSSWNLFCTCL